MNDLVTMKCVRGSAEPATPMMAAMGVDWFGIQETVYHVLNVLESQGATAIHLVKTILGGIKALTGRDMVGVFVAIQTATSDVKEIIAAIKEEFGL